MTRKKVGIIAGGGNLPLRLVEACQQQGRDFFIVALEGHADPKIFAHAPHQEMRLGAAGAVLEAFRREKVEAVVMAGHVRRPSLAELRPDWKTAKFFARMGFRALGDDSLLSAIAKELESDGFEVLAVQDIIPHMLAQPGVWGKVAPTSSDAASIQRGVDVCRALGRLDVGQSVVVQQGLVLGVEAIEGTSALVERCASLQRQGEGGILVKLSKPQQDQRVDLPTIGTDTVALCAKAGFRGIVVEAGGVLVVDYNSVLEMADRKGLFILGLEKVSP